MAINIKHFDSPEEYAEFLRTIPTQYNCREGSWCGASTDQGIKTLEQGDSSRLAKAQAIIDKLDLAHIFSNDVPVLEPCIAGFIPNVPAAIAGHPEAMFRRGFVESPSVSAPLAIYIEVSVSEGVSHDQLIARGVAVLAFALAMEQVRPVDVYAVALSGKGERPGIYGSVTKIASRPMDMSRAVWMLTDATYARQLHFTAGNYLSGCTTTGHVPWAYSFDSAYEGKVRKLLELQPDDVFMKGGYLFDTLMLNDPVAWVRAMIEKHSGGQNHD